MKKFGISAAALIPIGMTFLTSPAAAQTLNPNRVALLKWYGASQVAQFPTNNPFCVTFDGASIWVSNSASDTVTKLRASDGAPLGTFNVGTSPEGMAFDGAHIWVANANSQNVTELNAADGSTLATVGVGNFPQFVVFDGANIWVGNTFDGTVSKISVAGQKVVGTYVVGTQPNGLAFDGANIWVANSNAVVKLQASTGKILGTYGVTGALDVVWDGSHIWALSIGLGTVTKITTAGVVVKTLNVPSAAMGAFDGTYLWVSGYTSPRGTVTKINVSTATVVGTYPVGGADPFGVAFDGGFVWVASSSSNLVAKM